MSHHSLTHLTTKELQARFLAAFGQPTSSRNRPWLITRLTSAPKVQTTVATAEAPASGQRGEGQAPATAILPVGSEIRKTWRGQELVVRVQADGFLLNGTVYRSLSAAATDLCGGNRNGRLFFGLKARPVRQPTSEVAAQPAAVAG